MRPSVEYLEEALDIPMPVSERLFLEDSRRLTGPGLLWDRPGAIAEVVVRDLPLHDVEQAWLRQVRSLLDAVGWEAEAGCARSHEEGLNFAISAPIDQLYSAIFVIQAAWHYTASELLSATSIPLGQMLTDLQTVMAREANPALIALQGAARTHGVDFISDDDAVSLGHGEGSRTWPVDELPAPDLVDWAALHDVPVAMITGTNGKSTCVRLAAAVAHAAGLIAGVTSTDFVRVGDDVLDRGDYSGPGGARMLLRDPRLQIAFLEVARGGILRRGLALHRAQAALITNVAADHLGQYGINTVAALTEAKFSVFRTLARNGVLVVNADDPGLVKHTVKLAPEIKQRGVSVCWFSLRRDNPSIVAALTQGQPCGWLDDGTLNYFDGRVELGVLPVRDMPVTMAGAASYNVSNALGVMCLAFAFELPVGSVRSAFSSFRSDTRDNPGRCNEFVIRGAQLFVDFAHNPHAIIAVADTMKNLPAKRRLLMLGHAGDRSDQDIRELTDGALSLAPARVIIVELPDYLRGRQPGEVSALIEAQCIHQGVALDQISFREDPLAGARLMLEDLQAGDLALLLVLSHRDEVIELLEAEVAKS